MPDWGIALTPTTSVQVSFTPAPVPVLLHALFLTELFTANGDALPGLADWPGQLSHSLDETQRQELRLMYWFISDRLLFDYQHLSFPEFINTLNNIDAMTLRDSIVIWWKQYEYFTSYEDVLGNFEQYAAFMRRIHEEKGDKMWHFDEPLQRQVWTLLRDPLTLKSRVIQFLSVMWDNHFKVEWKRVQPMVEDAVDAFSQQDYSSMQPAQIVQFVTNRDLNSKDYFENEINTTKQITFVPSPYLGPYVTWMRDESNNHDLVFFGARLPHNANRRSAALNRNELLVRLNALADETRLRMLEMLSKEDEICAQDFITLLDLSQSSASRHLRQLTASGYVTERRRDVAKCYSLNKDRFEDTIQALQQFLS